MAIFKKIWVSECYTEKEIGFSPLPQASVAAASSDLQEYSILLFPRMNQLPPARLKDCLHCMPGGFTCTACRITCTACLKNLPALHAWRIYLHCMPEGLPTLNAWRIACTTCRKDCLHCMPKGLPALHARRFACTACLKDCLHCMPEGLPALHA